MLNMTELYSRVAKSVVLTSLLPFIWKKLFYYYPAFTTGLKSRNINVKTAKLRTPHLLKP